MKKIEMIKDENNTPNNIPRNLTMLVDFYEMTMANGYLTSDLEDTVAYFDMFFRSAPDAGGYAIMAGVEQLIEYLEGLKFTPRDIDFLREKGFNDAFLCYLENFEFACDVWAVPEGTPIFPGEPIVTVRGPVIQAQFIETMLLLCINHQSLIATKANRIARAAQGRTVFDFGARRAHGFDAAVYGARAAFIGGLQGSSNTLAEQNMGIPVFCSMAHSWVQMFESELEAFCAFARRYPDNCTLILDTYSTLKSGLPNAVAAFEKELVPRGCRPKAVRIDSGDIAYLSRKVRRFLDDTGFPDCKIIASNSLDEYIIQDMISQGAKVDVFGVGERLITGASCPVFGGVYKLCATERDGLMQATIKISENVTKITTPCFKKVWRLFDRDTGKAIADLITLADEELNENEPYELFDPDYTWKRKTVTNFVARPLLHRIFKKGKCVYDRPSLEDIAAYCTQQVDTLWEEVLRFEKPHNYYVDLSQALWNEKQAIIGEFTGNKS